YNRLYLWFLLGSGLLLVLHASQNCVTRPIAVIGDTLTAHLISQAIECLYLLHCVVVGGIDGFADARIGIALNRGLHSYMLFRREIVGCNEIAWRRLVGVLIPPCLEQRMIEYMFTCAVTPHHREVVYRLDTRTDAR